MAPKKRPQSNIASSSQPPQRTTRSRHPAPTENYDNRRFIHKDCQERFDAVLYKRALVIERRVELLTAPFQQFAEEIERRQWQFLYDEPPPGCIALVREMYANMMNVGINLRNLGRVYARGRWVTIDASTLNSFLQVPDIPQDDYSRLRGEPVDWDAVLQAIALPTGAWTYSPNPSTEPLHLLNRHLNPQARVWSQIMFSRLLPNKHISTISPSRCLLLYCLLTEKEVDLGKMIKDYMQTIPSSINSLPYPSLLTELARRADVPIDPTERMTDRGPVINDVNLATTLNKATRMGRRRRQEEEPPAQPQGQGRHRSPPSLLRLQAQIDALQLDVRSTRATLQNRSSRQYSSIYRGMQGLEMLLRQQISPELIQHIPPLPPADPELEHLTDEEADGDSEEVDGDHEEEADGDPEEDAEASETDDD